MEGWIILGSAALMLIALAIGVRDFVRGGGEMVMRALCRGRALTALLAVVVALGALPAVGRADDERPDLKIEVVGLDPNNPRAVVVRVTNVGAWWADTTIATVEAAPPTAGGKATETVPDLDPKQQPQGPTPSTYEFPYTLAAACQPGVKVRASLTTAVTFNGNKEANANLGNNVDEREACPASSKPPDPVDRGIVTKPPGFDPADAVLPESLRTGFHSYPYDASAVATGVTRGGGCPELKERGLVGWAQHDIKEVGGLFGDFPSNLFPADDCWWVAQTAVNFDLSQLEKLLSELEKLPKEVVDQAQITLTYQETRGAWTDGNGNDLPVGNCVERLGLATVPWEPQSSPFGARGELFANDQVLGHTPGVEEWYVTDYVRRMLKGELPRYGFVLRGGNEGPQGHDDRSCMSKIDAIKLVVTYEVPK